MPETTKRILHSTRDKDRPSNAVPSPVDIIESDSTNQISIHGSHQQVGSSSVGVQNIGDNNTFNISVQGIEPLHIVPWGIRCTFNKQSETDVELLQPYRLAIKMIGRDADLDKLRNWLHSEPPISVRTLTAPGGAGKTRMAIELLRSLDAAEWIGGFLARQELTRFINNQSLATWEWQKNCLIVVDYAASLTNELQQLLRGLTENRASNQGKLRILLLEREADPDRGWLHFVQESGNSQPVRDLFHPRAPEPLSPISHINDRRIILQEMLDALAKCVSSTGKQVTVPQLPTEDAAFKKQLSDSKWADPLYLMMAALLALDGDIVQVLALPKRAIAEGTLEHETERLRKFGNDDPDLQEQISHLAAVSTLRGGISPEQVNQTIQAECEALGIALPKGPRSLARILHNALPWRNEDGEGIAPILPDLLGEIVLLKQISSLGTNEQKDVILRAANAAPLNTAAVLLRVCYDYAEDKQSPAIRWLDAYIEYVSQNEPELFLTLRQKMPAKTLVLREHAFLVVEECLKLDEAENDEIRAMLLNEKSVWLSELGQWKTALEAAQEAVNLYRELAKTNSTTFRPGLAMSLSNLANRQGDMGQRDVALTSAQEAVDIYHELAEATPGAFMLNQALALNNLAGCKNKMGQKTMALATVRKAVNICDELTKAKPDALMADRAMLLSNLASCLSTLGHWKEALPTAQKSVDIRRKLTEANPDAFMPNLATSLNNLALCQNEQNLRAEALKTANEAVKLYRKLVRSHTNAFMSDLAGAYGILGSILVAEKEHTKAATAFAKGIVSITPQLQAFPQVFAHIAGDLCDGYVKSVLKAKQTTANIKLLIPIIEVFLTMKPTIEFPLEEKSDG